MDKNRNASASIFGWQFQINVAIYLMFKYFKHFKEMKVEGSNEDIEIDLINTNKIYAQAKSKEKIDADTSTYPTKLKKALTSLSDVNENNLEKLIYISNLEPNPLNSGTNEFDLVSFLSYDELMPASRQKIDDQLKSINSSLDKSKLIIAKIPFFGEDKFTKQKYISEQLEKFLAHTKADLISFSKIMLDMWESLFLNNATYKDPSITIKRDDILWSLLVFELNKNNSSEFDVDMQVDEEDYQQAIDKYEKVIMHKEGNFKIFNKITMLWINFKDINPSCRVKDFIIEKEQEIYNIVFEDNKNKNDEIIEKVCSKIVAKRIALRNKNLLDMFGKAKEYEN